MGLFDRFKRAKDEERPTEGVAGVHADAAPGVICAPVAGRVVEMASVPDPVFSSGAMGAGCGIWPAEEVVYAPVAGTVSVVMGHAVGLTAEDGAEVLVHVGIDTVGMEGKGFSGLVSKGEKVEAGQPLLSFSRTAIFEAGLKDVVVLAVSNADEVGTVEVTVPADSEVAAGDALLRVTR